MLSGTKINQAWKTVEVTKKQISKLKDVFEHALGKKAKRQQPDYVYTAFECFAQHKTSIYLHLGNMSDYDQEIALEFDIMETKIWIDTRIEGDFSSNTIRPELLIE